MADIIQIRRDTAANWTSANPTLAQGELGIETDTLKLKIGDGATSWTSLAYYSTVGEGITVDGTIGVGYINVPFVSEQTGSYTLLSTDIGKCVPLGTGGSITIPNSTFAAGDVVTLFNNTTGDVTITCSTTTTYLAGDDTNQATLTLATRGIATVLFTSATSAVVAGNVGV